MSFSINPGVVLVLILATVMVVLVAVNCIIKGDKDEYDDPEKYNGMY